MSGNSSIGRTSGFQPENVGSNPTSRSNPSWTQTNRLLIVGGGLAGSMLATLAEKRGIESLIIDNGEDWAASRASAMLTVPSWLASHKETGLRGFELLAEHWPLKSLVFQGGKTGYHLHMDDVLCRQPMRDKVQLVSDGFVSTEQHGSFSGTVVVAAGSWSGQLIQGLKVDALAGHSLVFKGTWPDAPVLKMWAPYRHLKIYQWQPRLSPYHPGLIWFGDSLAVKPENYKPEEMELASLGRARGAGLVGSHTILRGLRPVVKGYPSGMVERISDKLWVLTGGGKMGMTLYPALAERLLNQL